MPDQTLAAMVRAKYPGAYDDLSDVALEAQVVAKYPGVYDDVPKSGTVGAHPEARMSAAAPGTGWGADPDAVTVKDLLADPMDAIRRIGTQTKKDLSDPKLWAGIVLSYLGPKAYDAVAPVVGQASRLAMRSATTAAPKLVKYGSTVAGGAVGGWPGAILGREVGSDLGDALQSRMTAAQTPPQTPAAAALMERLSSGEPMPASGFMDLLEQVPRDQRAAILQARQAAVQASKAAPPQAPTNATGNATLDQFLSPADLARLGPTALSAVRGAVSELSNTIGVPLTKKLMSLVSPSVLKNPGQLLETVQQITSVMKNSGGAAPGPTAPTPSQTPSGPVAPSGPPPAAPPSAPPPAPPPQPPPQTPPVAPPQAPGGPPAGPVGQPPGPMPQPPPGPASGPGPMEGAPAAPAAPPRPPPPGAGAQPAAPPDPIPHPASAAGPQPPLPDPLPASTPGKFDAASAEFKRLNVAPQKGEVSSAVSMTKWGKSIEQAVRDVLAKRPSGASVAPVDPSAALAESLGSPSDAEMAAVRAQQAARRKSR